MKASVLLHWHQHRHDRLVIQFGHDARAADEPFTARGVTSSIRVQQFDGDADVLL